MTNIYGPGGELDELFAGINGDELVARTHREQARIDAQEAAQFIESCIADMRAQRDQARRERDEAVEALGKLIAAAERAIWGFEVAVEKLNSGDLYKLVNVMLQCGRTVKHNLNASNARAIVAKYAEED